jgi:hypothetical protein
MLGFIITRCIRDKNHDIFWKMSINFIRKIYKDNLIVIIDDNSNQELVSSIDYHNIILIQSEFPGAGELLPYYYFHKFKLFDKAVIMHDSVYIKQYKNFDSIQDIVFLWNFDSSIENYPGASKEHIDDNKKMLMNLNMSDKLIELYKTKEKWYGCFGVMSVIKHDFLKSLQDKYNFLNLINYVTCRKDRFTLERIFGLLCYSEKEKIETIYGDISNKRNQANTAIQKINSGR